jgi:hypothetical protein
MTERLVYDDIFNFPILYRKSKIEIDPKFRNIWTDNKKIFQTKFFWKLNI